MVLLLAKESLKPQKFYMNIINVQKGGGGKFKIYNQFSSDFKAFNMLKYLGKKLKFCFVPL